MPGSFEAKNRILNSQDVITPELIQKALGMTRAVADNLLSDWHQKGRIVRLAAGCYYSKLVPRADLRALWQTCDIRYGAGKYLLAGASAWSRAGWYIGNNFPIHIITADAPSTLLVKVDGIDATPVGQFDFKSFMKTAMGKDNDPRAPLAIHPIRQMTWWRAGHCPLPMPDANDLDWDEIALSHTDTLGALKINDPKVQFTKNGFPMFYDITKRQTDREQQRDRGFQEVEAMIRDVPR